MAKISPCLKKTFVFFNSLFAIFGIVIFGLGLFVHQYINEVNSLHAVVGLYVIGSIIFIFAVLGAYGAYKESKCALIVFFSVMCLATAGMLRVAIPLAVSHRQIISEVTEYFSTPESLTKDMQHAFDTIQAPLHCCGFFNGYKDWKDQVPESCDCMAAHDTSSMCESITRRNSYQNVWMDHRSEGRRVWSQPCGPMIIEYLEKMLTIMMGVFFGLAALAILGGLISLAMIIRISAPANTHLTSFPLSYQPPKYSEVVDY